MNVIRLTAEYFFVINLYEDINNNTIYYKFNKI
jgi:hypothetical protein